MKGKLTIAGVSKGSKSKIRLKGEWTFVHIEIVRSIHWRKHWIEANKERKSIRSEVIEQRNKTSKRKVGKHQRVEFKYGGVTYWKLQEWC